MDALQFGLPMVVIPLGADQPPNAQRCAELGVALVIGPDNRTAEAIRGAARSILGDPAFAGNAQAIQAEIRALPGLEYPVQLLERLATEGAPLIRL